MRGGYPLALPYLSAWCLFCGGVDWGLGVLLPAARRGVGCGRGPRTRRCARWLARVGPGGLGTGGRHPFRGGRAVFCEWPEGGADPLGSALYPVPRGGAGSQGAATLFWAFGLGRLAARSGGPWRVPACFSEGWGSWPLAPAARPWGGGIGDSGGCRTGLLRAGG